MVLGDLGVSGISMFSMMDLDMRMILEMWILPWMILMTSILPRDPKMSRGSVVTTFLS